MICKVLSSKYYLMKKNNMGYLSAEGLINLAKTFSDKSILGMIVFNVGLKLVERRSL